MIYIITHKPVECYCPPEYAKLQVGASLHDNLGYLKDNTGDNISIKNKNYCELTGLYWIWKNTSDDIKGLVHYRRFFSDTFAQKPISYDHIKKILLKYDVVLPFERKVETSALNNYTKECGFKKDIDIVEDIIGEKHPEYLSSYQDFWDTRSVRFFNMMIAKKDVFDHYCEWLFDILFELECRTDISDYNDYQKRIYGFMSERLLNIYFMKNNYRVFECGVYPTETNWPVRKRIMTGAKRKLTSISQMTIRKD